jgi:hypothetical protein
MATHNEVAHAWANQTGRHRKGFNMFYEGDTIYSYGYHFPIARIVDAPNGERVVLFTTENYSVSTSKHKTYTWRACGHRKVFHVPFVRRLDCADNVESYKARIKDAFEKAKRARVYTQHHLDQAHALIAEVKDFIRVFQVEGYEGYDWTPEGITADLRRQAEEQAARREAALERQRQEDRRRWFEDERPRLKAWLRDLPGHAYTRFRTPRPLPRVVGGVVETTWGASVPLEAAKKAYWTAIKCRAAHQEYVPQGLGWRVGDFHLTRIKANGDLVIGCHDIPFRFMQYAARRAGIPDEQPRVAA